MRRKKNTGKYGIGEKQRFCEDFRRFFPDVRMEDMRDSLLSVLTGAIVIDVVRLGRELERLWPDDWETMSVAEVVRKRYGEDAAAFLDKVTA